MMVKGKKIKELRESQKLSQEQLGVKAYTTGVTINRIENGHQEPSLSTLKCIADALGCKVSDLQGE
jgi:transcriptional regulator with XRE-family HTH domain